MKEKQKNNIVVSKNTKFKKSNTLINAKTKRTLQEEKILAIVISRIQTLPEIEGSIVCQIRASELKKILGDDSDTIYSQLDSIAKRMMNKSSIAYHDPEKRVFDYIAMVTRATYKDGLFTIKLNPDLKEHVFKVVNKYTMLDITIIMKFRSLYSLKIYEILKSYEYLLTYKTDKAYDQYVVEIGLAELKFTLGIADITEDAVQKIVANKKEPDWEKALEVCKNQAHRDFRNLKNRVLDVAYEEINSTTDLRYEMEYDRGGKGGKVTGIKFIVTPVNKVSEKEKLVDKKNVGMTESDKMDYMQQVIDLIEEKITIKDAAAILEASEYDLNLIKSEYNIAKKQGNIDSLVGWMIKACKERYTEPVKLEGVLKKNSFTNFEQQTIDDWLKFEKDMVDNY